MAMASFLSCVSRACSSGIQQQLAIDCKREGFAGRLRGVAGALAISGCVLFSPVDLISAWFGFQMQESGIVFASGLFQMPPASLKNRYFLVRAGESEYEALGIISTNPVAKTSVDNGLSEAGKKQSVRAARKLLSLEACRDDCWIWPSITQRAYQSAELIAYVNDVSRSHIVPEYSFLDARGLGAYEGRTLNSVKEVYETDLESSRARPPRNIDGTPNESVEDVLVRVTQVMSVIETQYAGHSIIIVSPDSDNLSILQAGLYGLDLRRHSELGFAPGEVREVDIKSIPKTVPYSGFVP